MTPDRDEEPGAPIDVLAGMGVPTSSGFLGRVRARIARRTLAIDLLELTWSAPAQILLEFLNVLFGLFGRSESDRGGR